MEQKRYTEVRIAFALRWHEARTSVPDIIRKMGVAEQTFYRWKRPCLLSNGAPAWALPSCVG